MEVEELDKQKQGFVVKERSYNQIKSLLYNYYLKNGMFMSFDEFELWLAKTMKFKTFKDSFGKTRVYQRTYYKPMFYYFKKHLIPKMAKRRAFTIFALEKLFELKAKGEIDKDYIRDFLAFNEDHLTKEDLEYYKKKLSS